MIKLKIVLDNVTKNNISDLHLAFKKLKLDIVDDEIIHKRIGDTTIDAIKNIQKKNKLKVNGKLNEKTLEALNTELFDVQHTLNKTRAKKLHNLLLKVELPIDKDELKKGVVGESTRKAIELFQKKAGLSVDGIVSEGTLDALHEHVIKKTYSTKTQIGKLHKTLGNISTIAKLDIEIGPQELKDKKLGKSSKVLIKAFQKKYKLAATGKLDKSTLDKVNSVAASKGKFVKRLKVPDAQELSLVTKNLRLNMVSPHVSEMQKNLSFLGYKIDEKEYKTQKYGKTTVKAVKQYQKDNNLSVTGHYDKSTSASINQAIQFANPSISLEHRYRIRGSVRDELWQGKNTMVIKIYEKILDKEINVPLAAKMNHLNGFFDIAYDAPINTLTGQVKDKFHLVTKLYEKSDQNNPVAVQTHYKVNKIHWVNFTKSKNEDGTSNYNGKYAGKSEYELTKGIITKIIGNAAIVDLKETATDKQITQLSLHSGLSTDDIMCQVLSILVAKSVNVPAKLTDEVFYAFIKQNLPAELPGDLLRGTSEWDTIDQLVELTASGIVFLDDAIQEQAIDNAVAQNIVSQIIKINKGDIVSELQNQRSEFTLAKPILVGNGNLRTLLKLSQIKEADYKTVATVFINNKGINPSFWEEIKTYEGVIGANAINDFTTTIEVGNITKNHISTVTFLKNSIGNEPGKLFKSASDIAKLDENALVNLINQNGKEVPDNMPGDSLDEKVANYAAAIKSRTEILYPAVSLVATVKTSPVQVLTKINEIESFIDVHSDFNLRQGNVDKYLLDNTSVTLDPKTKEELKVVQRTHKITTNALAGSLLIAEKLHSSLQIYFMGKDRLVAKLKTLSVNEAIGFSIYESAKMQYMQVIARLMDYRREMYRDMPRAIIPHTFKKSEIQEVLGDVANLETLFGSLDFCECEHCKSLYSPSAYLTDMLRFLNEHSAIDAAKTVKDILFDRRPDLGNIKLNCINTNTPLPYIDLVCEILENNLIGNKNFVYQTTLDANELRAIPEYVQASAYTLLADADFPMNLSFNLWQEESRAYLNYLRVPRYELMEVYQDKSDLNNKVPDDASIAAEYFAISAKEKDLIVTQRQTAVDQNKYWGITTTQVSIPVSVFMKRTKLSYYEVLELLLVKFVNDPLAPPVSEISRPIDTCDTDHQHVINLSVAKFDLMHRFIRLWRKTGWKMWELDLLIRNAKIGNNVINTTTLIKLKKFKQLQEQLKLPFETLLTFFGDVNREIRIKPDNDDVIIQPLYNQLFQNKAVTNPVDSHFKAIDNNYNKIPLDNTIVFGVNAAAPHNGYSPVSTVLSALALSQSDFDLLVKETNNHLSVNSLSILLRYAYLARSLKLRVSDLLLFLDITNIDDPFSSLQITLDSIKHLQQIKSSGLSILELDYIINYNTDSSVGLRDESYVQLIGALRNILIINKKKIQQLQLSVADRNTIINYNSDALIAMSDANLVIAFTPLKDILESAKVNFTEAAFSVEETNFIINYDTSSMTVKGKENLSNNIKSLQLNIVNLLNSNENQIKSHISSSFGLSDEQATSLLENINITLGADTLLPPGTVTLLEKLADENLIAANADGSFKEINTTNYPGHFKVYLLLHKASLLVLKMKIETKDLEWFIQNYASVNTLNFSVLPTAAIVKPNDYEDWYNLHLFLDFKSKFPEPENASIRSILDSAKDHTALKEAIFSELAELTQWEFSQITAIHVGLNYQHATGHLDYTKAELYHRFLKCFAQMKLTGVDATKMFTWVNITTDTSKELTISAQTRYAVKSKYEQDDWLTKVTPLHDEIREIKRTALVEYHLENSLRNEQKEIVFNGKPMPNPLYWIDSNSLYKYFLIDVEMSACQLTSRIKQALSSIQLFVQRCFLNLENRYVLVTQDQKEDASSPNAWSQWKWMKNYRIWEANRKIFFYPENWLEPELRDDKSTFFEDLENELLQNEVTKENVEKAFTSYLYKVDEVSNLEVCGMYHQMEDLDPGEAGYETNIVHVIGRTKAIPNIYYYRTYDMNYSRWSSWSKIEADITGDHVTPVVYNRKLHLFWLQFMDKTMKTKKVPAAQPSSGPTESPEPMKLHEVQLAWCIKKHDGWSAKKISKKKLIHPWERPQYSYNLKPYYLSKFNELYLDLYISTSVEFNNGTFYDPNVTLENNPIYLTRNRFNETYLPWHSSSFIFNGDVKDVKLKGLGGRYNYFDTYLWGGDSYDYVHENFGDDGEKIKELDPVHEYGPRLKLPTGMHFYNTHLTNNKDNSINHKSLRVLENTSTNTLLSGAISPFELVIAQQELQLNTLAGSHPMFYQDNQRAFFIKPEWETRLDNYGRIQSKTRKYRFSPFYHPYTSLFIRELNRDGIDGLLNRNIQLNPNTYVPKNGFNFNSYSPSSSVIAGDDDPTSQKNSDIVDFSFGGSDSIYNWELFFHAPLMVANRLMQNQKFEDAMHWFHYIFNPTNIESYSVPQRYWVTKPFFRYNSDAYRKQRIESILSNLNLKENSEQLKAWRNNPFKPHVIARYRPVAYQKNVVMKYLDNLIAWGDMLFKRDTIESINEASLLYMLAYEILGDRPQGIPDVKHEEFTFNQIETKLDEFGNARVDVVVEDTLLPISVLPSTINSEPIPKLEMFYFCIPNNDFLTKYWDTVADRLFKIRNCMNIQGVVRQLPLFEPPIDPALLVKAAAAGMDLSSVLNDLSAPTPYYRFRIVSQKALEFCNEVKILGDKLLSALEKKDVEKIALLRSQHEIQLLEAVKDIRKKQIDEAVETIGSLNKAFDLADEKIIYYEGREYMNTEETAAAVLNIVSSGVQLVGGVLDIISGALSGIPDFYVGAAGFGGSPVAVSHIAGGNKASSILQGIARGAYTASAILDRTSGLVSTIGGYQRRQDEWDFQASLATIEKDQIQFQINAAEIRQSIAEKELDNHELQIDNAKTTDEYMRNKYTNDQLYNWMITQISTVYFQAYQLAYDMAKKAEKCYQYELGVSNANIIQFGYWDSLKKGLLSGEKLMTDLQRLEAEYLNQNRREFEITKHVSLAQMIPMSLITLKETGDCSFSLPEWLFDMDYPGHYMRRIKNVSISIPCITGPYTSVNCTLSLLRNETRMTNALSGGNYDMQEDDTRFKIMYGEISSIATSHAQNDSGLFELNFNDDRYLPFEGTGAISDWKISMPIENNNFEFSSISDVVLHINYTSRNGGGELTTAANTALQTKLPTETARLFSFKHEFSTHWHRFLNPDSGNDQEFVMTLKDEHFPYFIRSKLGSLKIKSMDIFVESSIAGDFIANVKVTNASILNNLSIGIDSNMNNVHHLNKDFTPGSLPAATGEISLKLKVSTATDFKSLTLDDIDDLFILFQFGS